MGEAARPVRQVRGVDVGEHGVAAPDVARDVVVKRRRRQAAGADRLVEERAPRRRVARRFPVQRVARVRQARTLGGSLQVKPPNFSSAGLPSFSTYPTTHFSAISSRARSARFYAVTDKPPGRARSPLDRR